MGSFFRQKITELIDNSLNQEELNKLKMSVKTESEIWEEYFEKSESSNDLISEELFEAYSSAQYDLDRKRHLSFFSKIVLLLGFKFRLLKQNVREKRIFVIIGSGAVAALSFLFFINWQMSSHETSLRSKGGDAFQGKGVSHSLSLSVIKHDGSIQTLKRGQRVEEGEKLIFSIKSRIAGALFLIKKDKRGTSIFYPNGTSNHLFSVEDNNLYLATQQGVISYELEKGEASDLIFCSVLIQEEGIKKIDLEKEVDSLVKSENSNCFEINQKGFRD